MPLTPNQLNRLRRTPVAQRAAMRQNFLLQNSGRNILAPRGNGNNRRPARSNIPLAMRSNFRVNVPNMQNWQDYPPNSMNIPNNPSFHQQASNNMAIQHITVAMSQPAKNRTNSQFFAMRPSRHGYNALAGMFAQFRYINLEYRFVSTLPNTTETSIYIGYTPSNLNVLAQGSNLSSFRGFYSGNASKSSPWFRIITPPDTTSMFLQNSANSVGADATNAQGWIHYVIQGGKAATDTELGTVVGHLEIRGQVQFRAPM